MRPILVSIAPNWNLDDIWVHFIWLSSFKFLRHRCAVAKRIKQTIASSLGTTADRVYLFDSARSAMTFFYLLLDLPAGSYIAQQAFTCLAAVAPIFWAGSRPIYIDIDDSLNLDPKDLAKKQTDKLKVVTVQHTFGHPANLQDISSLCRLHNLVLVEDLAHSWGSNYHGRSVGTFGQAAVLSFGSDKLISCGRGGALVINDDQLAVRASKAWPDVSTPRPTTSCRQAIYPFLTYIAKRTYCWPKISKITLGKLILFFSLKFRLITKPIMSDLSLSPLNLVDLHRLPAVLLGLLDYQLTIRATPLTASRAQAVRHYYRLISKNILTKPVLCQNSVYLRYNTFSTCRDQIIAHFKSRGILLGNWYHHLIDPAGVDWPQVGYQSGTCPRAEQAAATCINLPTTELSRTQLNTITNIIRQFK